MRNAGLAVPLKVSTCLARGENRRRSDHEIINLGERHLSVHQPSAVTHPHPSQQSENATSPEEDAARPSAEDLKSRALHLLGVRKLAKWCEEDQESLEERAKEKSNSKRQESKQAHDAFVRGKKKLEIHLPGSVPKEEQPRRFIFAAGKRKNNPAGACARRRRSLERIDSLPTLSLTPALARTRGPTVQQPGSSSLVNGGYSSEERHESRPRLQQARARHRRRFGEVTPAARG